RRARRDRLLTRGGNEGGCWVSPNRTGSRSLSSFPLPADRDLRPSLLAALTLGVARGSPGLRWGRNRSERSSSQERLIAGLLGHPHKPSPEGFRISANRDVQ